MVNAPDASGAFLPPYPQGAPSGLHRQAGTVSPGGCTAVPPGDSLVGCLHLFRKRLPGHARFPPAPGRQPPGLFSGYTSASPQAYYTKKACSPAGRAKHPCLFRARGWARLPGAAFSSLFLDIPFACFYNKNTYDLLKGRFPLCSIKSAPGRCCPMSS